MLLNNKAFSRGSQIIAKKNDKKYGRSLQHAQNKFVHEKMTLSLRTKLIYVKSYQKVAEGQPFGKCTEHSL